MIVGVNRILDHGGKQYHIQVEDLGETSGAFEVRVYDHGTVLWHKRIGYQDVLARRLPRQETEEAVRELMEKTSHTVEAAIVKGKLS